jgi:hypothetical protein
MLGAHSTSPKSPRPRIRRLGTALPEQYVWEDKPDRRGRAPTNRFLGVL